MKCIKEKKTGVITRVDDSIASQKVDSGTHVYVPRSEWKREVRDVGKEKK